VELARKNLSSVINRKQAGEQIIWNASFVEKVVKQYLPELYSEVAKQLAQDTNSATSDHKADARAGVSVVQPHSSISVVTLQNSYPWLDITVYAGGGSLCYSGIKTQP